MLSDEQMSNGWPYSLLNDEQMSNKVRVEHQPDNLARLDVGFSAVKRLPTWLWWWLLDLLTKKERYSWIPGGVEVVMTCDDYPQEIVYRY